MKKRQNRIQKNYRRNYISHIYMALYSCGVKKYYLYMRISVIIFSIAFTLYFIAALHEPGEMSTCA